MQSNRSDEMSAEFCRVCISELREAVAKIGHCVDQLSEKQLWWRPAESMNSVANLMLHLTGNVRQWIVAGLGERDDTRNRPQEFAERGGLSGEELQATLHQLTEEVREVFADTTSEKLLRRRSVQGFDVSGMEAVVQSIAHFRGHTQEIVSITRLQLGDRYRFDFVPGPGQNGNAAP